MNTIHLQEEAVRCLLCENAPCTQACKHGDPAKAVRAIRFGNARVAGRWLAACNDEELAAVVAMCHASMAGIRLSHLTKTDSRILWIQNAAVAMCVIWYAPLGL